MGLRKTVAKQSSLLEFAPRHLESQRGEECSGGTLLDYA